MAIYQRFYKCIHYDIRELVDPITFSDLGEAAWQLFDPLLLGTMDKIRGRYNTPITVNNWHTGGPFKYRGFRPSSCTEGAKLSAHRRGQAFDFDVVGLTADLVRQDIRTNQEHIDFGAINRVELATSWVHVDTANVENRIVFFKP